MLRQTPSRKSAETAPRAAASNETCSMRCGYRDRTRPWCAARLEIMPRSELHRRHLLDFAAGGAEVEEILAGEAERRREQRGRHLLNAGVVFLNRVVEEAAAGGDLVFEIGQFARQLLEIGVGLEVRIGLGQCDQLAQRARELVFGGGSLSGALRRHGGVAGPDHVVERAAFMRGIAFYSLDQIWNQVVSLFQLYVDIGEGLADPLTEGDKAVVCANREENENDDDAENNQAGRHGIGL